MTKTPIAVAALLLACGCARTPPEFAVPVQRALAMGRVGPDFGAFLKSGEKQFDRQVISGMTGSADGSNFRWTSERVEIRFFLDRTDNLQLVVHGGVHAATFQKAGSAKFRLLLNGRVFAEREYRAAGGIDIAEPTTRDMLNFGENRVVLEIDPPIVAELDGAKLGFVLNEVGFLAR